MAPAQKDSTGRQGPVTERRDPSWSGTERESPGPGRFRSLVGRVSAPRSRNLAPAALAGAIGLALVVWLTVWAANQATAWLHRQDAYRLPFDQIRLDPPPEPYLRDPGRTILDRVRRRGRFPDTIPVLEQDLAELGRAFPLYSPWVKRVDRVTRTYPTGVTIRLAYCVPVARVVRGQALFALDADGIVLPGEDLKADFAAQLIRIDDLDEPIEPRPGLILLTGNPAAERNAADPKLVAALKTARFLREHGADVGPSRIVALSLFCGASRIMLRAEDRLWILWGEAPGDEPEGGPSAREKLEMLRRWRERPHDRPEDPNAYLWFSKRGARLEANPAGRGSGGGP